MTQYLLDTHVFLWLQAEPDRIRSEVLDVLGQQHVDVFCSAASSWEISIKYHLGKLDLPDAPDRYVPAALRRSGIEPIPVGHSEALRAGALPPHHRDPFDRLIVAQAQLAGATVVTADTAFDAYGVDVLDPR